VRLSEWRDVAPHRGSMADKVLEAIEPVLVGLGGEEDPPCWVAWGDDPAVRYTIFALSDAGVITCLVRVNVPQEGPRASGRLIRWNRVQTGELSVENQGGHTMVSFQLESQLVRGVDGEAGQVTEFALDVLAGLDGRPFPSLASVDGATAPRRAGRAVPALPSPGDRP
jgi:hypothetical protein